MLANLRRRLADRFSDHLHAIFGTDRLPRMEQHMATVIEALTALAEQVNRVSAAQATSFTNLQNAIAELKRGELTDEQARLVAQIEDSLTTLADDAQRGDDGYEPQQSGDGQPDVVLPETDPQEPGAEEPTVTEPKVPAEPADETTLRR